jgi:hypothetical protein
MPKKRFSAEQIAILLRQIEVLISQGKSASLACRDAGIKSLTDQADRPPQCTGELRAAFSVRSPFAPAMCAAAASGGLTDFYRTRRSFVHEIPVG